jgi:hypothetical protein
MSQAEADNNASSRLSYALADQMSGLSVRRGQKMPFHAQAGLEPEPA